jgi:protein involved in polysaccharide export with SLBB domain
MLRFKIMIPCILIPLFLCACSPLIPSNYLGTNSIQSSQYINGQRIQPTLIPISSEMLNTPKGRALLEPALTPAPYEVGAYDNLNIIVWGHPEISTVASAPMPTGLSTLPSASMTGGNPTILVQTDGTIFFPYVGHLRVNGLTVNKIQAAITNRLSRFIRNPQVTVQVEKYRNRNIYVLGEVRKPGMQPLTDRPLSLMEAISSAGNIDADSADPAHIYLVRGTYQHPEVFWLDARTPQALMIAERFPLKEYDIVYVSAAMLSPWTHFINQVLPSFSTYFTIKGLANR